MVTRAEVSHTVFEEVFQTEQECILAAFEHGLARLTETVQQTVTGENGQPDRLLAGLVAFLRFLDDEPGWGRLVILGTALSDPRLALACTKRVSGLLSALLSGDESGPERSMPDRALRNELVIGGVISVVQRQMRKEDGSSFLTLAPGLMSFIGSYLGQGGACLEFALTAGGVEQKPDHLRPVEQELEQRPPRPGQRELPIRITHRTTLVLRTIALAPRSSNRQIAEIAGLSDEGQTSKLLARLAQRGLLENRGRGQACGEANEWQLTRYGQLVLMSIGSSYSASAPGFKARRMRGSR